MLHPPPLIPYVIVFDDHPLVGRGMAQYLQAIYPALTVHLATCWADVQMLMDEHGDPKVLVADVWIFDSSSLTTLTQWRAQFRRARVCAQAIVSRSVWQSDCGGVSRQGMV